MFNSTIDLMDGCNRFLGNYHSITKDREEWGMLNFIKYGFLWTYDTHLLRHGGTAKYNTSSVRKKINLVEIHELRPVD